MLRFKPARLRERIGLIVLLHAVMMIGVLTLFVVTTDPQKIKPLYRLPAPEKVALVATAFEHTPPETHGDLTRAFTDASLHVALLDRLPPAVPNSATPATLERYRDALGGRPFRIELFGGRAQADLDARPAMGPEEVRITVGMADGHAVSVEQKVIAPVARIVDNLVMVLLVIVAVDILVILWLASQTTGPVERLAKAVREDRLDAPRPGGPREIVQLAEDFRQLRTQLRDLMHERTRMLAAIAHDYRTYLTRLELRSEFIEDEEQRSQAVNDLAEMRLLLNDTLTFARESTTEETDGATCDVRAELAAIAAERRGRDEDVGIVRIAKPILVHASHLSFQRMLANLLDNALRYGGGRAMVRVRSEQGSVHILVEDEGPGVPEESLGRLLEPFERLEPSRARHTGGVGLGLSIVQALAHRYHGTLGLENRKEGGFRAVLTLRQAAPSRALR